MPRKTPPSKPPERRDKAQAKRFVEAAKKLEAAGELDLAEAGERFERGFKEIVPPKVGQPKPPSR